MIAMTISKPEMTSNANFFKRIHPFMKRVILSISKLRAKFSWSNMSYFMFAICLLILKVNWHIYVLSVRASRYLFTSMAMSAGIISYQRAYSRLKWKLIKNNKSKRPLRCRLRKTLKNRSIIRGLLENYIRRIRLYNLSEETKQSCLWLFTASIIFKTSYDETSFKSSISNEVYIICFFIFLIWSFNLIF